MSVLEPKRALTEGEIAKAVERCFIDFPIPEDFRLDVQYRVQKEIERQLKNVKIYPGKINQFLDEIAKQYRRAIINPGETVGEQGAQSFGAPTTQIALNAFHSAGKISRMTTGGLPRMSELVNCSQDKDIKNPSCTIFFNQKFDSWDDIPTHQLLETRISHIVTEQFDILPTDLTQQPWWYKLYQSLFSKIQTTDYFIRLELNKDELYKRRVTPRTIAKLINEKIHPVASIYSPIEQGIIDVYVDTTMVGVPPELNHENITEKLLTKRLLRDYITPIILDIYIKGVKDIKAVYTLIDPANGEYFVETDGSNLKGVLMLDFVCSRRTLCNRPNEIYSIFGITGLEAYYGYEFTNIFEQSSSYVNPAWIGLINHHICHTGTPVPANRFGHMKKQEVSTFTKATFEEMTTHLIRAGLFGQHDPLQSIAGCVVTGKRCKHGTGMIDVAVNPETITSIDYPQIPLAPQSIKIRINKSNTSTHNTTAPDDANVDDNDSDEDDVSDDASISSVESLNEFDYDAEPDDEDFVDF